MKYLNRSLIEGPFYGLCQKEMAYLNECKRLKIDSPPKFVSDGAHATTHTFENVARNGRQISIVCMPHDRSKTKAQIAALLVHEAAHIWQHVEEDLHITETEDELEAYSIQSIFQELVSAYRPPLFK